MQLNLDLDKGRMNRLGYSYVQVHCLIEIDNDNGKTRTVDFASYPVQKDNWQYIRFKKRLEAEKHKKHMPKKFQASTGETEVEEI